jgi:hypothetical protein
MKKAPTISLLIVMLLMGCITKYDYIINIQDGSGRNTEFVKKIDSALKNITRDFEFTNSGVEKDKNGQNISFYDREDDSHSGNTPISIHFYHKQLTIILSTNSPYAENVKKLKRRILDEIREIAKGKRVKIEEKQYPSTSNP